MTSGAVRLDMTKRLLYLLPVVVFGILAGYFLWGLDPERDPRKLPSALIDDPVPDFALPPLEGAERPGLSAGDLRAGEVTLVNIFASWCVPCRVEHPVLMRLAEDGSVPLVGINYKDPPAEALQWLAELGNPYGRIGVDETGRVAIDWGVYGVPETYVIDKAGKIRYRHVGPIMPQDLKDKIMPLVESLSR